MKRLVTVMFLLPACLLALAGCSESTETGAQRTGRQAALAMQPDGYWPADEGEGDILHDRSGNDNHGKIFHIAWEDDLLNFTNGFQWTEIPASDAYQDEAFTMGGRLFSQRGAYRRNGMLFMGIGGPTRAWKGPVTGLRIREGNAVEVLSDGKADAIGSQADKETIAINQWQRVLYTYAYGTGKLPLWWACGALSEWFGPPEVGAEIIIKNTIASLWA